MRASWRLFDVVENGSHGSLGWRCSGGQLPPDRFTHKREGRVQVGKHEGRVGVYGKCPMCNRMFVLIGFVEGESDG